jgi:hypothetical protein
MTALASAHVLDFPSLATALRWRRRFDAARAVIPGLVWAKAATTLGSPKSGGFAAGWPQPQRQFAFAVWTAADDFGAFCAGATPAASWREDCEYVWHLLLRPARSTGTHHGANPLQTGGAERCHLAPMAALTLGRFRWRHLPGFVKYGSTSGIMESNGLITALSAGFGATGNYTFSLWEREEDMISFAFRVHGRHRKRLR